MKIRHSLMGAAFAVAGALLAGSVRPAQAQATVAPGSASNRLFVDLKDASLMDALEMIFQAAGVTTYSIDPTARAVNVGNAVFTNQEWNEIVLNLARSNNFRVRRDADGSYRIDPRPAPMMFPGSSGMPGMPGMPGSSGSPWGGGGGMSPASGGITTFGAPSLATTRVSPQILPGAERGVGGGVGVAEGRFQIIEIQHVYAGGIAFMFDGGTVLTTSEFIVPESALQSDIGGTLLTRPGYELEFQANTGGGGGGGNTGGGGGGVGR